MPARRMRHACGLPLALLLTTVCSCSGATMVRACAGHSANRSCPWRVLVRVRRRSRRLVALVKAQTRDRLDVSPQPLAVIGVPDGAATACLQLRSFRTPCPHSASAAAVCDHSVPPTPLSLAATWGNDNRRAGHQAQGIRSRRRPGPHVPIHIPIPAPEPDRVPAHPSSLVRKQVPRRHVEP